MNESMLDFMGFGPPSPTAKPATKCFDCKVEGKRVVSKITFSCFDKILAYFTDYSELIKRMEEDHYCDTYECEQCGRRWRTLKGEK